jgi:AcrR family transcriptional regulator
VAREDTLSDSIEAASEPRSRKGRETRTAILGAALDLMGREGYASLTLGRVATETGIRKGNLQYYFPTKRAFLRAVVDYQVARQKQRWRRALARAPMSADARLETMIRYEIRLDRDEVVKAQASEKWAFAAHDDEASATVTDWYDWVAGQYADLIAACRPDLDRAARENLGAYLYSLLEGANPFFGKSRIGAASAQAFECGLRDAARRLVRDFAGP